MTTGELKALLNSVPDDVEIEDFRTVDDGVSYRYFEFEHSIEANYCEIMLGINSRNEVRASIIVVGEDTSCNTKTAIIDEVSKFLQHNGFTDASKAVDCHWDL
jgi:hypothetical protein